VDPSRDKVGLRFVGLPNSVPSRRSHGEGIIYLDPLSMGGEKGTRQKEDSYKLEKPGEELMLR